jgi:hypothetical protein
MAMRVKRLFDLCPPRDMPNPEAVMAGVVQLFESYPDAVVDKATSVFGIPSRHTFTPSIAEIREFLDAGMAPLLRQQHREKIQQEQLVDREIDRSKRISYQDLCKKYGGDGRGGWGLETNEKKKTENDWTKNAKLEDPDDKYLKRSSTSEPCRSFKWSK